MPLVSVVIPITNYDQELLEAVDSVLNQTMNDLEIILVDNHATPKVRSIAEQLEKENNGKIRLVSEEKRGAASARNRGIFESYGGYIALLDSDDRMKPNRIESQLAAIQADPEISLVGSWKDDISPDGKEVVTKNCRPDIPRWATILFQKTEKFRTSPLYEPQTSSFFFQKEKAQEIGFFDERFDPYWLHDTFFVYRMYLIGKVYIVPEALSEQRMHTEEDGKRRVFDLKRLELMGLFYSILKENHYIPNDPDSCHSFQKLRSRWLREAGTLLLSYKKGRDLGKFMINRALEGDRLSLKNWETYCRIFLPRVAQPLPCGMTDIIDTDLPEFLDGKWAREVFE
ncbi:MAG: glycosyltransferase family A protein [Leptospirales bacterium]